MTTVTYLKPILIFLSVIAYLAILLHVAFKYPSGTTLKVELDNWVARPVCVGVLISLPVSIFFAYYFFRYKDMNTPMVLGMLAPFILIAIDQLSTNPKRKSLAEMADTKFKELILTSENPELSLNPTESTEIYNQDYPIYVSKSFLVGVTINRVCRNNNDKYFHIYCSYWGSWSEAEIKQIDKSMALSELAKRNF